ncbi:uncharacterized protein CCR75_008521 [Bremia lactucae]|uniref:Uncharacterized protein n=1 Tax=Bremia lactucae TaxID=4779 RepID=A0A976NYR5_BRELC|nr:hypothetical protein CCR75_008521 [Bremia lactucae]
MEFQKCLTLLASRPANAHEKCEKQFAAQGECMSKTFIESAEPTDFKELEDMPLSGSRELVQRFLRLQETRVQIYAWISKAPKDGSIFHILCDQKGKKILDNIDILLQLFSLGSNFTDTFSKVSERINQVEKQLRHKQQVTVANLIRHIQMEEKEKLLLTSAELIEKMRLSDALRQVDPDEPAVAFLNRSLKALIEKHTACVIRINGFLEDLCAEIADLED